MKFLQACKNTASKLSKVVLSGLVALGAAVSVSTPAHAVTALTMPTIDLTDMYAAAGVILTAVAAIWVIMKVIGFFRSR